MEDGRIIELYWARDQQAIQETAGKYGRLLERIARNILGVQDAEECVNDTYLRAWNAIPPERPAAFRNWLGRITRNLSLDRWKRLRAEKRGGGAEVLLGELEECVPAGDGGPERALEDRELAEALDVFLRGLSREGRSMFLRRYWYGESLAEIGAALGCGEGKVKSSLFRSRKALRAYLEEEGIAV